MTKTAKLPNAPLPSFLLSLMDKSGTASSPTGTPAAKEGALFGSDDESGVGESQAPKFQNPPNEHYASLAKHYSQAGLPVLPGEGNQVGRRKTPPFSRVHMRKIPDKPDRRQVLLHNTLPKAPGEVELKSLTTNQREGLLKFFKDTHTQLAEGNYSEAGELLKNVTDGDFSGALTESWQTGGMELYKATEALQVQVAFTTQMQARLKRPVSFPPTEKQLQDYFSTFNSTTERPKACKAFAEYAGAFHIPQHQLTPRKLDMEYSDKGDVSTRKVPDSFDEVTKKRKVSPWNSMSEEVYLGGRYLNDSEGYAHMAEKLLGAAGYKLTHVTVCGKISNHAMVALQDPEDKRWRVASNGNTYEGDDLYTAFRAALEDLPSAENNQLADTYYLGSTMRASQVAAINQATQVTAHAILGERFGA